MTRTWTIFSALILLAGCSGQQALAPSSTPTPPSSTQGPSVSAQVSSRKLSLNSFQLPPTPSPTLQPTQPSLPPPSQSSAVCQPDSAMTNCGICPREVFQTYYGQEQEEKCGPSDSCPFIQLCQQCGWQNTQCPVPESLTGQLVDATGNPAPANQEAGLNCAELQQFLNTGQTACVGKPVIYLYPQKDTRVNVSLQIPGTITDSIPTYPIGGWQNILAHPSGIFDYQGKSYRELFYESAVNNFPQPNTGIILKSDELSSTLPILTAQLGLLPTEQQEFMDYWLPKLQALNSPYVLFSVLTPTQKDVIDHVDINPKPDTFIDFLVSFKPLQAPIAINPLILPKMPPQRVGFTAVEWGGTLQR